MSRITRIRRNSWNFPDKIEIKHIQNLCKHDSHYINFECEAYGVVKAKAEYDDMEKIAIENQIDMSEIELLGKGVVWGFLALFDKI
jgi:uncharacterized protein (DUF111 family)